MKLKVLGCSGGIGREARTTSFLIDDDILIDAGTGVNDLSLDELKKIDHVFLTHSHLDHVGLLPLMLDTVGMARAKPVVVHAQEATIAALKTHLFNNVLWPDFSRIPTPEAPFLVFEPQTAGTKVVLGTRSIESIYVNHVVPAVGYLLSSPRASVAFSGDTTITDQFWRVLNACENLTHAIVETSFLDKDEAVTLAARHLGPRLLAGELKKLTRHPKILVTHLMTGMEDTIMQEVRAQVAGRDARALRRGEVIEF
jgi:ribonuclease BN (tRNA processing enzyme)